MGLLICKLYSVFEELGNLSSSRILMLGLNAAGKTTILYKIKLNESVHTIPTIGFNVETVSPVKGINFVVHDIGGQENIRRLWTHYYENTDGLIYIVDSNDRERLKEARDELRGILDSNEMRCVPVVVIANKQDLPNAMNPSEVAVGLSLPKMTNRKWGIHGACATTGDGIFESMKEMADMLQENEKLKEY